MAACSCSRWPSACSSAFCSDCPRRCRQPASDVNEPLRLSTGRMAIGRRAEPHARGTRCAEIALAVVLVTTGTLLVRSLVALQQAPLGFQPANVLLMQASAAPNGSDWSGSRAFFRGRARAMSHSCQASSAPAPSWALQAVSSPKAAIGSIGCRRSRL